MLRPSPVARGVGRLGAIETPYRGWNTRDPLAGMQAGFAPIFDNFVVEGGQPRVRRGWREWASDMPARVDGLLTYNGAGADEELFAVSDDSIFDITSGGAVGTAVVTGLTSARMDGLNFAAAGGNFLLCFNGADVPQTYDGSAWAAWTATAYGNEPAWAAQHAGRLYVGEPGYLGFYYGGAGAIAGAFTAFPLQGVARRGGGVVAMATLSGDGGAGPQDLAVFITSEGEAIVYAGTDPGSTSDWALVGRWALPRPVGAPQRCVANYGGDVLYACDVGIVSLSDFRSGAPAGDVVDKKALTSAIGATWRALTNERRADDGWGLLPLTRHNLVVANVPWGASDAQQVVVSDGGALSRWGGIPAAVWAEGLGGRVFAGDATDGGRVLLWGEDISDDGNGIRSEALCAYSDMRSMGRTKRALRHQQVLRDAYGVTLTVRVRANWELRAAQLDALGDGAAAPPIPALSGGLPFLVWDAGNWDETLWVGDQGDVILPWRTANAVGQAFTVHVKMVSGNGRPALLANNVVFDVGGPTG